MSSPRFAPEFDGEAVRQIVDRAYSVAEVSERLGVAKGSQATIPMAAPADLADTPFRHNRTREKK